MAMNSVWNATKNICYRKLCDDVWTQLFVCRLEVERGICIFLLVLFTGKFELKEKLQHGDVLCSNTPLRYFLSAQWAQWRVYITTYKASLW